MQNSNNNKKGFYALFLGVIYGEKHNSYYEGGAVLLSEIEEALFETDFIVTMKKSIYENLTLNHSVSGKTLESHKLHAKKAATELIQVVAMCDKNLRGYVIDEKE